MNTPRKKLRVGALISGGGTNLQAIIDACEQGAINARMVFVGSDRDHAKGLDRAKKHEIPTFVTDYAKIIDQYKARSISGKNGLPEDFNFKDVFSRQTLLSPKTDPEKAKFFLESRAMCEAEMLCQMARFPHDLLVLAGFMRTLTPYFIDHVNTDSDTSKIMNIHPALLPSFPGVDGYGDTFRYGCKVGGCTVHFVDYGEDTGPIIGQKAFDILPGDNLETVRKKGLEKEWRLYPECIELFARGRLKTIRKTFPGAPKNQKIRTIVEIRPKS